MDAEYNRALHAGGSRPAQFESGLKEHGVSSAANSQSVLKGHSVSRSVRNH
jgi:hypothetical protein